MNKNVDIMNYDDNRREKMKITFLGTGAADWYLDEHKHMNGFRRNSSVLIDDCLLIDPGPHVPDALESFKKDPELIKYIINSHRHRDHFNQDTVDALKGAALVALKAEETVTLGKYTVTALSANHSTAENPVHFIISDGEKRIFYGLDGAWLMYHEVKAIKDGGADLAIIDATSGEKPGDFRIFEHNNLNMVREIKASLDGYVKRWIICHMARILHDSHEVLAERMRRDSIEVAYDGLEVEI